MPDFTVGVSATGTPIVTIKTSEDQAVVPPLQLRKTATYLQWRYKDVTPWENLVAISDITGPSNLDLMHALTITDGHHNDEYTHPLDCLIVKGEFFGTNGRHDPTVDIDIVDNTTIRLKLLAAVDENSSVSGFMLLTKVI